MTYLVLTQEQDALLHTFKRATTAMRAAERYDESYDWWTAVALRVRASGVFDWGREIFRQPAP